MRALPWATAGVLCAVGCGDVTIPDRTPRPTGVEGTGETGAPPPCAVDPTLTLAASATPGPLANQVAIEVETSAEATVAARCVADDDPAEAHLVEDTLPGTHHELRFLGLLTSTAYTCSVAATCPTTGQPAVTLRLETSAPAVPLPTLEVEVDPALGMTGAYTLAPWQANALARVYVVVWGPEGHPRWWFPTEDGIGIDIEALLDPGTTHVVWGGGDMPTGAPSVVDLWDGEIYKASLPHWGNDDYTHDAKRVADGRLLSLQYVPNALGDQSWVGFGVRLHDQATGTVSFQFDSQRYVDEGILPPGRGDAWHANWVDWKDTSRGPVLYVSLYYAQRILAIDGRTGDLLWDLGAGRGWTVLDDQGQELGDRALPEGQHGLEVEGDGDELLVYDNGLQRLHSRAERWRVDPATKTATRTWSWTEPGWYEPILGDVDDLGHGRVLVTEATLGCCLHPTDIVEVDVATGKVASRLSMPSDAMTGFRSQRYDGCALFASTAACPRLAARAAELEPLFR